MVSKSELLQDINNELEEFVKFSKTLNLSEQEIYKIALPLTGNLTIARYARRLRYAVVIVVAVLLLYSLTWSQAFNEHAIAISRILLIKVLPFWDWRKLQDKQCMLSRRSGVEDLPDAQQFNCALCESLGRVDVLHVDEATSRGLFEFYTHLHRPVVITHGVYNWRLYETPNITALLDYPKLANSYPCALSSNVHNYDTDLDATLNKLGKFRECFAHFRNCEVDAVRAFRALAPRPAYLPPKWSPVRSSWLMYTKNYEFARPKHLNVTETNAVVAVVKGTFVFELVARLNCKEECPKISVEISDGEVLLVTSLWDLSYTPDYSGENIAVVLEIR